MAVIAAALVVVVASIAIQSAAVSDGELACDKNEQHGDDFFHNVLVFELMG